MQRDSAEVLTPITGYRNHPVDELVNRKVWGAMGGIGKNSGLMFAFWDAIFRTLYVPIGRENFATSVAGAGPGDFASLPRLYFLPFVKATPPHPSRDRCCRRNPASATPSPNWLPAFSPSRTDAVSPSRIGV